MTSATGPPLRPPVRLGNAGRMAGPGRGPAAHTSLHPAYLPPHTTPHASQLHDRGPATMRWSHDDLIVHPKSAHQPMDLWPPPFGGLVRPPDPLLAVAGGGRDQPGRRGGALSAGGRREAGAVAVGSGPVGGGGTGPVLSRPTRSGPGSRSPPGTGRR